LEALIEEARMVRVAIGTVSAVAVCALGACSAPAPPPAAPTPTASASDAMPGGNAGWTGLTEPLEVIEARRLLMLEAERQMRALDLYTLGEPAEPAALRSAAVTIEPLILALPHLFPPTTNLYDPRALDSPTIALPALWRNFATFQKLTETAEAAAVAVASADGEPALKEAARNLRAACDGCHQTFTKKYEPPKVTDEDLNFDFEAHLPN
jgi:cytochrome c556